MKQHAVAYRRALVASAIAFATAGVFAAGCTSPEAVQTPEAESADPGLAALGEALTFHASFDNGADADHALGDKRIYSAASYEEGAEVTLGVHVPGAEIAAGAGRFGDGLRFNEKNTQALFYQAKDNVAYSETGIDGTVSFWLSLDPATDLEPGYCDPIQVTDDAYNDSAVWVDFTDKNPRQFRLGVFGDLAVWNPDNKPPDKNPDFDKRLVAVAEPPFSTGKWNHVVVTYSGLNSATGGRARLYLDGKLQGESESIPEPYTWDVEKAAIRLGVNYVGLYDELAIFDTALSAEQVKLLHGLEAGVAALRR